MPRAVKLTWQSGKGRPGRWRKVYKGKAYVFPGGKGKTDMAAYDAALVQWERMKVEIDRTAPRKHQKDYERCIDEWERVRAWSSRYGDKERAEQAEFKVAGLRRRFAALKLAPLRREDWFESSFDPVVDPQWLAEIVLAQLPKAEPLEGPPLLVKPSQKIIDSMDGSPARIEREVWRDRLAMQDRKAAPKGESVADFIQAFLAGKAAQEQAKQLSTARLYALKLHLQFFEDWIGRDTPVVEIDGPTLTKFHGHLLEKLAAGSWKRRTAWHYLSSVKALVNWLYDAEAIAAVPRIMRRLLISKPAAKIEVFTVDEVKKLLASASRRTRLYILLALNTGTTQVDISDLKVEEVDWTEGRIIRRRSKTKDDEHVPVVNYQLWPKTFELLKLERATDGDRVLVNANGSPLLFQEIKANGKLRKCDNVKSSFDRLKTKTGIDKSFKALRKTSATLLCDSEFMGLEGLFLGHAPGSVAAKHYARTPQQRFDQAVQWLGKEYGLVETTAVTSVQEPAVAPAAPNPLPEPGVDERKPKGRKATPSHQGGRRSKGLPA